MDPIIPLCKPKWLIHQEFQEFLERCSKPKMIPKPPKVDRGPRGGPSSDRLAILSAPIDRLKYLHPMKDKYSWAYKDKHPVKESALNYVASSRIVEMSAPKYKYMKATPKPLVKKGALNYVATPRIVEIAKPMKPGRKWRKKKPIYVKPKALKYKASKRIVAISKPSTRPDSLCRDPFSVNPAALTAFASKRIKLLAEPKPVITQVREHPIKEKYRTNQ